MVERSVCECSIGVRFRLDRQPLQRLGIHGQLCYWLLADQRSRSRSNAEGSEDGPHKPIFIVLAKDLIKDLPISVGYTPLIVLLVKLKIIEPLPNYFPSKF